MTVRTDAAVLALQESTGINNQGASENMPANVIVLSEEELGRKHSSGRIRTYEEASEIPRHTASGDRVDSSNVAVDNLSEFIGISLEDGIPKKPLHYRLVKRAFDVAFSACVIVVGFVPGLVLCAVISADTKGSPIYTSTRIGRGGKSFRILKFRTMVADADDLEKHLNAEQLEQWHKEHKVDNDPRITKLGEFLRSSSIDEFPQFINVLFGQMSTIGCRAITREELANFGIYQDLFLSQVPGITGMWQCGPRNIATFESGLRQKIELMYVTNASLKLDTKLFFKTFKTMLERTGR